MSQEQQKKDENRKNVLLVDSSRCIGCFSCEVACKLEHDLPAGPRMFKVIQIGPVENGDDLLMNFMAVTCLHCDRPACVLACPTGAMQKRADGIVFSDPELCIGCRTCAVACPFGSHSSIPQQARLPNAMAAWPGWNKASGLRAPSSAPRAP